MTTALAGLILAAAAEIVRFVLGRFRKGSRAADAAKTATWILRPLAAACAANAALRLKGYTDQLMSDDTYPLFAVFWHPGCNGWAERFRAAFSSAGVPAWLPVSLALCAAGTAGAFLVARLRARRSGAVPPGAGRPRAAKRAALAAAVALAAAFAFSLLVAVNSLPDGLFTGEGQRSSFLIAWHSPNQTMLYAIPAMQSGVKNYWRDFAKIQPRLRVHARSHPPVASSFVRWIGKCAGVDVEDPLSWRDARSRLRYALGQSFFSTLNVVLVFLLGLALFDGRTGLFAALIYAASPTWIHYGTFAPDMNYALFFHGALLFTWLVATLDRPRLAVPCAVALGLCFSMLNVMTFSWCIATTVSAAFIVLAGAVLRRRPREILWRAALPLCVMAAATGWFLLHYHVDYLSIYRDAYAYHGTYYNKGSFVLKLVALFGGQAEWLVLLGPLTCTGFFLFLSAPLRAEEDRGDAMQRLYLLVLLGVYAIPVLFGPAGMKHEVARCWLWIAALPVVCSARHWLRNASLRTCSLVFACSALFSTVLRLFVRID